MPNLTDLIEYMQGEMSIHPLSMYCQFTGKPIGRLHQEEIESLFVETDDLEQVADDLMIRTLASMRPGVCWNVMRLDSLETLAKSRPTETLAYLLNRLFQPVDWIKLPFARRMDDLHQRIKLYQFLSKTEDADYSDLFAMLIEIDAKMNLGVQSAPCTILQFMLDYDSTFDALTDWYHQRIKVWTRNQKHEEDQRRWMKGNTVARPAFLRTWLESKPESKTAKAKREKKAKDNELAALFESVMLEAAESPKPDPIAVAATPVARKVGLPAFLIRKEA